MNYSILMAVYEKEKPEFFEKSILSMLNQTVPSDDFVIVCDGPLNRCLDGVINKYQGKLNVIRNDKKIGLSKSLNIGLAACKNEFVARMDSDDISASTRCEQELKLMETDSSIKIVSGTIQEFIGEPKGDGLLKKRVLPECHEDLVKFSRKRNPFNHPAVMFRKSAVLAAGGYNDDYHRFEDYDLWIRMLRQGAIGYNIQDTIVYMRVSEDFYLRRGGRKFARDTLRFHKNMIKTGWSKGINYLTFAVPHAAVCIMPNSMRKLVYKCLRKD